MTSFLRFRVIPVTMMAALLLLGVKVDSLLDGGRDLSRMLSVKEATAAQDAFAEEKATEEKVAAEQAAQDAGQKPAEGEAEKKENAEEAAGEGEGAAGEGEGEGTPEKITVASKDAAQPVTVEEKTPERRFTQIEIDLLQSLSERREEIEKREKEVEMRATVLDATEQRIGDKIAEMQGIKGEVEALLAKYNEQEDAKIRSLVKIYENMKPKDAARIFEEVEMPILLLVVDRMAEKKVALILAKMSAAKAKEVTMQLAEQRRLQKNVAENAQAVQGAQ